MLHNYDKEKKVTDSHVHAIFENYIQRTQNAKNKEK